MIEPSSDETPVKGCTLCGTPLVELAGLDICPKCQLQKTLMQTRIEGQGVDPAETNRARDQKKWREERYQRGGAIASGGMGQILDASEVPVGRRVAMKVIHDELTRDDSIRLRFIEEAQITGQLEHPSIVPMHDLGIDDRGHVFYTMKKIEGDTLTSILRKLADQNAEAIQEFPLSRLLTIFQKICDAIAFAHSRGVIHRDLKPENVMVGHYGELTVLDWGLAKMVELPELEFERSTDAEGSDQKIGRTLDGTIMGTPGYMSPEQAEGEIEKVGYPSDIYALGAILYEILTLRSTVHGATSLDECLERICSGAIISPTEFSRTTSASGNRSNIVAGGEFSTIPLVHCPDSRVPQSLAAVAMKALSRVPEDRYSNVEELQAEIEAYQNGFATVAEQANLWRHLKLFARRHRVASVSAVAVLLAILFGGIVATVAWREAEDQRKLAEKRESEAQEARSEAEDQRQAAVEARQSFAGLLSKEYVARGMEEWEAGSLQSALWWALEAYRTVGSDGDLSPELETGHRLRIASLLRQLPKMRAVPDHELPVKTNVVWTGDGKWAVVGHRDGKITLIDAKTWEPEKSFHLPGAGTISLLQRISSHRFLAFDFACHGFLLDLENPDAPIFKKFLEDALGKDDKLPRCQIRVVPDRDRAVLLAQSLPGKKALLVTWDLATGKVLARTELGKPGKSSKVALAISPDGRLVAFSLQPRLAENLSEKRFGLVETDSHRISLERNGRGWAPVTMAFHPDGRHLAVERDYRWIEFLDLRNNLEVLSRVEAEGSTGIIGQMEFSEDGEHLLVNREGVFHHLQHQGEGKYESLFEPVKIDGWGPISDDRQILTLRPWNRKGSLRLVEINTGSILQPDLEGGSGMILSIDRSPNGKEVAVVQHSGLITRWIPETGEGWVRVWDLETVNGPVGGIRTLLPPTNTSELCWPDPRHQWAAISHDGSRVLTGHPTAAREDVLLWDADEGKLITPLCSGKGHNGGFGFLGTSRRAFLGWTDDQNSSRKTQVFFVDGNTGEISESEITPDPIDCRTLASADGSVIATFTNRRGGGADGSVIKAQAQFWRAEDGSLLGNVTSPQRAHLTLSADGSSAFMDLEGGADLTHVRGLYLTGEDRLIRATAGEVGGFPEGAWFMDMRGSHILPGNRRIISGDRLYGLAGEKLESIRQFQGVGIGRGLEVDVAVDGDGKRVAISTTGTTVNLFDIDTGDSTLEPLEFPDTVARIAFSPDGNLLAVGSVNGEVHLLDSHSGDPITPPFRPLGKEGGQEAQFSVRNPFLGQMTFSGNGRRLLISTAAGGVYLWEVPRGDDTGNINEIMTVASLAAGKHLGGENHGDPMAGREWQEKWRAAAPEVRRLLLQSAEMALAESENVRYGPWLSLLDDKMEAGWQTGPRERFSLENGHLIAQESETHSGGTWLLWRPDSADTGDSQQLPLFEDFELRARVKTSPEANSGLRFHVDPEKNNPNLSGVEIEISGGKTFGDRPAQTGNIVGATRGLAVAPHESDTWFDFRLIVEGSLVTVFIDDRLIQAWRQPEGWKSPQSWSSCQLGSGTFAIQASTGTVEFRDLRVRRLNIESGK